MDAADLTQSLGGKWRGSYGTASCPAHDDHDPSLSISERDGKLLVKCHTGCSQLAVLQALRDRQLWPEPQSKNLGRIRVHRNGLGVVETPPAPTDAEAERAAQMVNGTASPRREIVATYDYRDEQGERLYQSVRYAPKDFRQRQPNGRGGWVWNLEGVRLVLYRLPELLAADPSKAVYIVEGEKDADRLAALGLVATTSAMGAGKWRSGYVEWLTGRHVVILPDNDQPGRAHADAVAKSLVGVAASVRVVQLPNVPEKGDVSDWFDAGGNVDTLTALVEVAPEVGKPAYPMSALHDLMQRVDDEVEPFLVEDVLRRARCHWVYAGPGVGKTMCVLSWCLHIAAGKTWQGRKVKQGTVLYFNEDMALEQLIEYAGDLADASDIDTEGLPLIVNEVRGLRLNEPDGIETILAAVDTHKPVLVVLDSCERILPSSQYTTEEFDPMVKLVARLVDLGITVIVVDHTNKMIMGKDFDGDMLKLLIGGRSKSAVADEALYLSGSFSDNGIVTVKWTKMRRDEPEPLQLRYDSDQGITAQARRMVVKAESERKILAWMNNHEPSTWRALDEISDGTEIRVKTADRVLRKLARRGFVEVTQRGKEQGGKKNFYRVRTQRDDG